MFSALLNRAQSTVDTAIGQFVNRAIMAVPFVLAGAFATAALAFRLVREFGPETANLILAAVFLILGLVAAIAFRVRPAAGDKARDALPLSSADTAENAPDMSQISDPDRELLVAAVTSALPIALPSMIRLLVRHWPIVLAVVIAIFVMTREASSVSEAEPAAQ